MKKDKATCIFRHQIKLFVELVAQDGRKVENQVFKNSEDKPKGIAKQASFKAKIPKKISTGLKSCVQKNKENDSFIPSPQANPYESYMYDQNRLHLISISSLKKIKDEEDD